VGGASFDGSILRGFVVRRGGVARRFLVLDVRGGNISPRGRDDVADQAAVALKAEGKLGFIPDAVDGLQQQLRDVRENGGVAGGDAILGEQGEDGAESLVDVGGGVEAPGVRGPFVAAVFRIADDVLGLGVFVAERGMGVEAEHATLAIEGITVLTASWVVLLFGHGFLERSEIKHVKEVKEVEEGVAPSPLLFLEECDWMGLAVYGFRKSVKGKELWADFS